MVIRRRRTC